MLVKTGRRRSRRRDTLATIVGCGIVAVGISNLRLGLTLPVFDIGSLGINNPPAATGGDAISQGGSYRRSDDGNATTTYQRYHEVASEVQEAVRQSPWRNNNPSRADATVVRESTTWFLPRRACRERCCVSTVAVSMTHESRKIINTVDGNDLADVRLQQYKLHPHLNQGVGALYFREEMIPCLVPGTIFDMDNHKSVLNYFMYEIRPRMRHPYAMITAESDAYSPLVLPLFEKDELLLKWHGTNPRRDELRKNADKFRPMGLGLSSKHQQERHLLPFLRLNNFTNPFERRKERYDSTKHPLDFDEDVFVHFGNRDRQPRKRLWEVLCNETSPAREQDVSCNDSGKFSGNRDPHALYADASRRRFGLSPPGHGWDCYRTYELLLLGVIPIVDGSPPLSRELFEGLPVVFMQNMAETIRSRKDVLDAVARYVESDEFRNARPEDFGRGWDRLFLRYRRRLLLRDAGRERDILVDDNGIEYYQAFHYTVVGDGGGNGNKAIYCSEKGNCESDEDASKLRWGIPNLTDSDRAFLRRWNNGQNPQTGGVGEWEFPEALFTPEEFLAGRKDRYINLPVLPANATIADVERSVSNAIATKVNEPFGLMHKANPPGKDVFMGLAAWPKAMNHFKRLVGSYRRVSDGHMILGVHSEIPAEEQEYLKKMNVTFYSVEMVECDESIAVLGENKQNVVRGRCSKGHENLKLEWGRFAMAREWLDACEECTGWAMVADTRDLFFQANPFVGLSPPDASLYDLIFMEEISKHTCPKAEDSRRYYILANNAFYRGTTQGCYGEYHLPFKERPILCSGTIMGTRKGLDRFLAVYVEEFHANNRKENEHCRSPHASDQMILQQMYYTGRFGGFERTITMPWGTGPVNTIGHVCVDKSIEDPSKRHSAKDMVMFDDETGLILNNHEEVGSPFRISPAVHQWDRCHNWIHPFFRKHPYLFEA